MTRRITLTLGTSETERRKKALQALATVTGTIGRNGEPSISELISRLADAAEYDIHRAAAFWNDIYLLRCEALAVNAEQETMDTLHK
jgi:hypothetical protein